MKLFITLNLGVGLLEGDPTTSRRRYFEGLAPYYAPNPLCGACFVPHARDFAARGSGGHVEGL